MFEALVIGKSWHSFFLDILQINQSTSCAIVLFQTTPNGQVLQYCTIRDVVAKLETDLDLSTRSAQVEAFNKVCGDTVKMRILSVEFSF